MRQLMRPLSDKIERGQAAKQTQKRSSLVYDNDERNAECVYVHACMERELWQADGFANPGAGVGSHAANEDFVWRVPM